jgi:hypothetical protein
MGPDPPGEWEAMQDAPRIYRPASPLTDYTEINGHWHGRVAYRSRALPRGAVTVIIDVGRRQQLDFYGADGHTRLSVPPAFITGSPASGPAADVLRSASTWPTTGRKSCGRRDLTHRQRRSG